MCSKTFTRRGLDAGARETGKPPSELIFLEVVSIRRGAVRTGDGRRDAMTRESIETRVLLSGLAMGESPRWHEGRLWFPHWGTPDIVAVDLDGKAQVVARGPSGLGHSIGWLPDGRLLVTGGDRMTRHEQGGATAVHVDLSAISRHLWSEMTLDGRGNIYVDSIGFDFEKEMAARVKDPARSPTGIIALVTPDGK